MCMCMYVYTIQPHLEGVVLIEATWTMEHHKVSLSNAIQILSFTAFWNPHKASLRIVLLSK